MENIDLIISQRQFVYNQIEGRRISAERERQQQMKKEIERNKAKQRKIIEVSYFIIVWCLIVLAFMLVTIIGG